MTRMLEWPQMLKPFSRFLAAWLIGSIVLAVAAAIYAGTKSIPAWAALPITAAFLVEYPFYLASGFESVRARVNRALSPRVLGLALTFSGLLPYLIYSLGTGQFHWRAFLELAAIAAGVSYWYVILPRAAVTDIVFLGALGAILLGKVFRAIYISPLPHLQIDILGHLMLIRLAIVVILLFRRMHGIGFGLIPSRRELLVGIQYFAYFLPIGFPLAWYLGLLRFRPHDNAILQLIAVGLGIFWVVALSEEFLFRGVLQQWIARWTGSRVAALVLASIVFGLCHLSFRIFPNWPMVLMASVIGVFCGLAYWKASSIRASMVFHTLVATAYRVCSVKHRWFLLNRYGDLLRRIIVFADLRTTGCGPEPMPSGTMAFT